MKVKNLKEGHIVYGVPLWTGEKYEDILEIYEVIELKTVESFGSGPITDVYQILCNSIVGDCGYIALQRNTNLNKLIPCYYSSNCTWGITCSEKVAKKYYQRYLNKDRFRFTNIYSVWTNRWQKGIRIYA